MKKIIALVLGLMMLCGAATAETAAKELLTTVSLNGAFELRCAVPEGYTLEKTEETEVSQVFMLSTEDITKPLMVISIAFDELHADVERLNDLSDEDKAAIAATWSEEDHVEISYLETSHGTQLMAVRENDGVSDYVDFYTIYKGYDIEFVLVSGASDGLEFSGLTDEQIQLAIQFLSELDFIPIEA